MHQILGRSKGLLRAVEECGSFAELGRRLGIRPSTIISNWWRIPPRRLDAVAQATGIPREELSE